MKSMFVPIVVVALVTVGQAHTQETTDSPYRVTHPADRVTCLSPGLETSPITACVIDTDAGFVLIDTGLSPSMAARTRARIDREMGRDDVGWVINTHSHFDHTGGNQVFTDALIIGHERVPAEMQSFDDGREAWIERRHRRIDRMEAAAADADPGSAEARALEEDLRFDEELIYDLGDGYRSTPPTVTFSDRLSLVAGDLEFRLVWMGEAHTTSDILVQVPDLGVVFTGDLFFEGTLGVAFYSLPIDPGRWLEALDAVLDDDFDIAIGGHGFVFTPGWLAVQRRYLGDVWLAVNEAKATGASLAGLRESLPFDERFADVAEVLNVPAEDLAARHSEILENFWQVAGLSVADEAR